MNILLWCDDLMTRVRLESAWKTAGATLLKKTSEEKPDLVVIDLGVRDALGQIARQRNSHPAIDIVVFGPHYDAEAFKAAKEVGATELAARSTVLERILRRLPSQA